MFLQTHPATAARIGRIRDRIEQLDEPPPPTTVEERERLDRIKRSLELYVGTEPPDETVVEEPPASSACPREPTRAR